MSSKEREESYGDRFGNTWYGIFSYYLIQGFTNPMVDKNHDEWISAQEAFDYAKPLTTRHMHKYNREQHPVMYDNYPGEISITRD